MFRSTTSRALVAKMDGPDNRPSFLARHLPSILVLASQISAAAIHAIVKILETGTQPVHPFQILQVRLFITGVGCTLYLWSSRVPDFPLGPRDTRLLLALRALGGLFGAVGFYCTKSLGPDQSRVKGWLTIFYSLNSLPYALPGDSTKLPGPLRCNYPSQMLGPRDTQSRRSSRGLRGSRGCVSSGTARQQLHP